MTTAKLVTLKARAEHLDALDSALARARDAAAMETGTRAWEWFPGGDPHIRVIIEVFADDEGVADHDASPAVAELLACFTDVLAVEPDVQIYTRTAGAVTTEEMGT